MTSAPAPPKCSICGKATLTIGGKCPRCFEGTKEVPTKKIDFEVKEK